MKRIGFIGLGTMGSGIAGTLLKVGYDVTVWSRKGLELDGHVRIGTPSRRSMIAHHADASRISDVRPQEKSVL